jgi:hypothetical protein
MPAEKFVENNISHGSISKKNDSDEQFAIAMLDKIKRES